MKKVIFIFLIFFSFFLSTQAIELPITSKNAILYNLDENSILYEKNSEQEVPIASLTKIMTSIVAIENLPNLDEKVTLTYADFAGLIEADASVAGFYVGEEVTIRDLLYGLLLPSGADAAQALTRLVAESREEFVKKMNEKVKELGLEHTNFVNETGLHDENHYSTVKDVAEIFKYALNIPELKDIFSHETYQTSNNYHTFFSTVMAYKNSYGLDMDYLIGGKTGTTDEAGLCLATFASSNNTNYLLVTTGADSDGGHIKDAQTIYDYFISNYETYEVISENDVILTLKTLNAKEKEVPFKANKNMNKYLLKGFKKTDLVYQYDGINSINYFTKVGSKLGTVSIILNGEIIDNIDIVLSEKLSFSLLAFLLNYWYGFAIIFLIIIIIFLTKKVRHH